MITRLWPYILGNVALGLDAYVIAGLLPALSQSFNAPASTIGLGVAAFTGAYAISGPLLAGRAGQSPRRSTLATLAIFSAANLATAFSPNTDLFIVFRTIAGIAAGIYSPMASAIAAKEVPKEFRGKALSLVLAGLAFGTVFGVPIGLWVASTWSWRITFILICLFGVAAMVGILLRQTSIEKVPASDVKELAGSFSSLNNSLTVTVTLCTAIASLGLYTFISTVLEGSPLQSHPTLGIWVWGIGGAIGALCVGLITDRINPFTLSCLLLLGLTLALAGQLFNGNVILLGLCLFIWGLCGWSSLAPQQLILVNANPGDSATAIAVNSSANYLGSAVGSIGGSAILAASNDSHMLILCALALAGAALGLQLIRRGRASRQQSS